MRWLIAEYQPVALFSLKHGEATSTGGKSLLLPTPFAIRMALLDAAVRTKGLGPGHSQWGEAVDKIKALTLAVAPPEYAAVTSLFAKVLKPARDKPDQVFQKTIAFREYVHLHGTVKLAFSGHPEALDFVEPLLPQVTYFGKRGSFFQLVSKPTYEETSSSPPKGFILMEGWSVGELPSAFPLGTIQRMDDWGPGVTPKSLDIYSDGKISLGKERIRFDVVLPYRIKQSGRGFTFYERI